MNPGLSSDVADQATGTYAGETPAGPAQFGRLARSLGRLIGSPPTGASPRERPPRGGLPIPRPLGVVDYSPVHCSWMNHVEQWFGIFKRKSLRIAATHRDLKQWSDEGKYRPDLYHRIGGFAIDLPPLRERGDDLPMLVRRYLHLRLVGRELGREVVEVAPAAMDCLRDYSWPGNIRDGKNVVRQALLRGRGPVSALGIPARTAAGPESARVGRRFGPGWPLP